jgi:hypothetical protein
MIQKVMARQGQKHTISYGRSIGSSKMAYSDRKTIVTIVE